jgi:phage terminase large subunit-like protein
LSSTVSLPERERLILLRRLQIARAKKEQLNAPVSNWRQIAREKQLPPTGDWSVWLLLCGRAFGKSRTGGESVAELMNKHPGSLWGVIGPKWSHTRDVPVAAIRDALKLAGWKESQTVGPNQYAYNKSDLTVTLPNGAVARGFSAETPDSLRGFNLWGAWCDEICFFPRLTELWYEALVPAVRIGDHPHIMVTTTPRPKPLLKDLVSRNDGSVAVVVGSTWENADNLSPLAVEELRRRYEGTRRGRQELYGELIWEAEGALWNAELIEAVQWIHPLPDLIHTVVSVDPSGSATGDATGIVTCALGADKVVYVLSDDTTQGGPEHRYEQICIAGYRSRAGVFLYETLYGGDNIAHGIRSAWQKLERAGTIKDMPMPRIIPTPVQGSKADRAHPVVALYEQTANGYPRIRHAKSLPELEEEMVQWEPGAKREDETGTRTVYGGSKWSPNRIDAMVYGARYLTEKMNKPTAVSNYNKAPALPAIPIR